MLHSLPVSGQAVYWVRVFYVNCHTNLLCNLIFYFTLAHLPYDIKSGCYCEKSFALVALINFSQKITIPKLHAAEIGNQGSGECVYMYGKLL